VFVAAEMRSPMKKSAAETGPIRETRQSMEKKAFMVFPDIVYCGIISNLSEIYRK
jgi:hypothetical protein